MQRVGLFIPCFIDQLYPRVGRATVALLERCGCAVDYDPRQTCCGQPAFNGGYVDEARRLAERFIELFGPYECVVAPSGSCVSMVRNHYAKLADDPLGVTQRVHELCEFLVARLGVIDVGASLSGRAALHPPCHLLRELHGAAAVRRLLSAVRGLELLDWPADDWCCGFGGTFSVRFPELSAAMGLQKLRRRPADVGAPTSLAAAWSDVDYLISPESSCLMQLEGLARRCGIRARALHVAEALAGDV